MKKKLVSKAISVFLSFLMFQSTSSFLYVFAESNEKDNSNFTVENEKETDKKESLGLNNIPKKLYSTLKEEMYNSIDLDENVYFDLYSIGTENIDGSKSLFTFNYPIKYYDKESGCINFIDNTISKEMIDDEVKYVSHGNSYNVIFSENISDGLSFSNDQYSIEVKLTENANENTVEIIDNELIYDNVIDESTSICYSLENTGIKESIIVDTPNNRNTYDFLFSSDNLTPKENKGQKITLVDKTTGESVVFEHDNTFIISEDLTEDYYEINTYEGDIINLDIQLDPEVYDFKTFEYSSADKKTIITYDKNLICTESGEDTVYISIYSKSLLKHRQFTLKINILPNDSIPDEIRGKIEKLNEPEHSDFQRKKLELLGALDVDVPRINMDIITEFIETSDNFFEIGDKINNLTKVPDVKINGELTFYSYWFDDKGTEEIAVGYDYPCSIYYYRINDDGKRTIFQDLYPVKKDPVEIDQIDYDYILYKNIFGDGINYGDINFDDTVDLSDLTMMSQYLLKDIEFDADQIACADVNLDDEINLQDLALMKQYVMNDNVQFGAVIK